MMNIRSLDVSQNNVGLHGVKSDCCGQRILLHKVSTPKQWKSTQRRHKHCALAVVRWIHKQTNKHINRQGRLQYTAQLSAQCNKLCGLWCDYINNFWILKVQLIPCILPLSITNDTTILKYIFRLLRNYFKSLYFDGKYTIVQQTV